MTRSVDTGWSTGARRARAAATARCPEQCPAGLQPPPPHTRRTGPWRGEGAATRHPHPLRSTISGTPSLASTARRRRKSTGFGTIALAARTTRGQPGRRRAPSGNDSAGAAPLAGGYWRSASCLPPCPELASIRKLLAQERCKFNQAATSLPTSGPLLVPPVQFLPLLYLCERVFNAVLALEPLELLVGISFSTALLPIPLTPPRDGRRGAAG